MGLVIEIKVIFLKLLEPWFCCVVKEEISSHRGPNIMRSFWLYGSNEIRKVAVCLFLARVRIISKLLYDYCCSASLFSLYKFSWTIFSSSWLLFEIRILKGTNLHTGADSEESVNQSLLFPYNFILTFRNVDIVYFSINFLGSVLIR